MLGKYEIFYEDLRVNILSSFFYI